MSIFFICGKPRGGKSYQAIKAIGLELLDNRSKRNIVTNLPLKMDDYDRQYVHTPSRFSLLRWYLFGVFMREPKPVSERRMRRAKGLKTFVAERCPHMNLLDLKQRLRILEDNETGEFWLYEPGWEFKNRVRIELNHRGSVLEVPDFRYSNGTVRGDENAGNPGTLYLIDEIHLFFPARAWQRTGEDCTYFLSQHGKMKCDVLMITQHPDQCDKALRNLAQEYMSVRNLSREPIMGFRLGSFFRVTRMFNSPKSGNPQVFDSHFVGMDWETFGDLYDTSAGVGIQGSLVPNEDKRGLHIAWFIVPLCLFVACMLYIAFNARKVGNLLTHVEMSVAASVSRGMGFAAAPSQGTGFPGVGSIVTNMLNSGRAPVVAPVVNQVPAPAVVPAVVPVVLMPTLTNEVETNFVYCTGFCVIGSPQAWLSDGRSVGPDDGLESIEHGRVRISGRWYLVHRGRVDLPTNGFGYAAQPMVIPQISRPNLFSSGISVTPSIGGSHRVVVVDE